MSIPSQPKNFSLANADKFQFTIKRLPNTSFFLDAIVFPELQFNKAEMPTPFKKVPFVGDELGYTNLKIRFGVDEDFANYKEIFNWIKNISNSNDFSRYPQDNEDVYSDAGLIILTNNFKPNISFTFTNVFPVSLNLLSDLNIENKSTEFLRAKAEFALENVFLNE